MVRLGKAETQMNTPGVRGATLRVGPVLGAVVLLLISALPASAAPARDNCTRAGDQMDVWFQTVSVGQAGGSYVLQLTARVLCRDASGADVGEVLNSGFQFWTTLDRTFVNGQPVTGEANAATISTPEGVASFSVMSPDPTVSATVRLLGTLPPGMVPTFNTWVDSGNSPLQVGSIFVRTPELSSLALFGAGAASLAGYAVTRARSLRGRRSSGA